MYAGTTFHNKSGHIIGAHQRVDRAARRCLKQLIGANTRFPSIKPILHFEGRNGPDGIKSKSPASDEPWHFVNPLDQNDTQLYDHITNHSYNLTQALKRGDESRAAFEAAWLAHAIVDGLTPAHQFPFEEEIEKLWGKPKEDRITVKDKNIIRGDNRIDTLKRNWQYWGTKGLWTTHYMFEWGFSASIASVTLGGTPLEPYLVKRVAAEGFMPVYKDFVQQVYALGMYEEYYKKGWTHNLARESREILAPLLVVAITLAWYEAYEKAKEKAS